MSSILKALRKLEEEKAALGEGGVDIARDILKRSARRQERSFFWPLLSGVLFLLLIGTAVFFGLNSQPDETVVDLQSQENRVSRVSAQGESLREQAGKDAGTVQEVVIPPFIEMPAPQVPVVEPVVEPVVVSVKQNEPTMTKMSGLPFLKVSGIAYRENPLERIAIINDLPVMQGTAIEGAQVLEILPEVVVLEWKGKKFEQRIEDPN